MTPWTTVRRSGQVVNVTLCLVAVAALCATLIAANRLGVSPRASLVRVPVTGQALAAILIRAGLDAESLAAAGVTANQVAEVVNDAQTYIEAHSTDLATADAAYAATKVEVARLEKLIQSGSGTANDVSTYATQAGALGTARTSRLAALDAIYNAGIDSLSMPVRNTLAIIRANKASSVTNELPTKYLVLNDRTEAQWVTLRDALANERIAAAHGESPDSGSHTTVTTYDAIAAVSTASTSLNANLATLRTNWTAALD